MRCSYEECTYEFDDFGLTNYVHHLRNVHQCIEMKCLFCPNTYSNQTSYFLHIKKHLSGPTSASSVIQPNMEELEQAETIQDPLQSTSRRIPPEIPIKREITKIILKFLAADENTRKVCVQILKEMFSFIKLFLDHLLQGISLEDCNSDAKRAFEEMEKLVYDGEMASEHVIFRELRNLNLLINYEAVTISSTADLQQDIIDGVRTEENKVEIYLLNIELLLSALFNNQEFFSQILSYIDMLGSEPNDIISNIMQTEFWKQKISELDNNNDSTLFLPLICYFDEFEPLNALGAHSGAYKVGGVYLKLGCLPPKWQSLLDFIFTFGLFFANDRVTVKNSNIFKKMIQALNYLFVNGIRITNNDSFTNVKFIVVAFTGDNLGVHQTQDFCANFSTANYMCRVCKCHRTVIQVQTREEVNSLRSFPDYFLEAAQKNVTDTGIHCYSVFNNIKEFNVIDNSCVDVMHDILEGVAHYDLAQMLQNFIQNNYFTLDWLNLALFRFDFGKIKNRPDCVSIEMLEKRKFKFSGSEMKTFLLNLNLIIGDKVPENNEIWKLYLILKEFFLIVNKKYSVKNIKPYLISLVESHHILYVKYFGTLKFKHHLMVHYPSMLEKFGNLSDLSNMRFESAHQKFIKLSKVSKNKKNSLKSMSIKAQLKFANLLANFDFKNEIELVGKNILRGDDFQRDYNIIVNENNMFSIRKVIFMGKVYKKDVIVNYGYDTTNFTLPLFAWVELCLENDGKIFLVLKLLKTIYKNVHFDAYEIEKYQNDIYGLFEIFQLENKKTYVLNQIHDKFLINAA